MGLDLYCKGSDEYVHFSYSGFFRIREVISDAIGLPLHFMEGFLDVRDNGIHFGSHIDDIKEMYRIGLPIDWNILKYDPLYKLIYHSDCDGKLSWRASGKIAKRLNEIKDKVKFEGFNIRKENYEKLIKLLEDSHRNKKQVNFG